MCAVQISIALHVNSRKRSGASGSCSGLVLEFNFYSCEKCVVVILWFAFCICKRFMLDCYDAFSVMYCCHMLPDVYIALARFGLGGQLWVENFGGSLFGVIHFDDDEVVVWITMAIFIFAVHGFLFCVAPFSSGAGPPEILGDVDFHELGFARQLVAIRYGDSDDSAHLFLR